MGYEEEEEEVTIFLIKTVVLYPAKNKTNVWFKEWNVNKVTSNYFQDLSQVPGGYDNRIEGKN